MSGYREHTPRGQGRKKKRERKKETRYKVIIEGGSLVQGNFNLLLILFSFLFFSFFPFSFFVCVCLCLVYLDSLSVILFCFVLFCVLFFELLLLFSHLGQGGVYFLFFFSFFFPFDNNVWTQKLEPTRWEGGQDKARDLAF